MNAKGDLLMYENQFESEADVDTTEEISTRISLLQIKKVEDFPQKEEIFQTHSENDHFWDYYPY